MRRHAPSPSLGQIAAEAGVSRAAVSMALRNHPRIPPETRQRIQLIATRLGWKPNPLLAEAMSAIRAGQPPADRVTLAWLTAHPRRDAWRRTPFFRRCFEGAEARAAGAGYRLEHFWLGDADGSASRLGDILLARGITGVVISPLPAPTSFALPWDRLSAVAVAYTLTAPRLHRAADNHYHSARLAVRHLRAAGRRRIALAISADYDRRVNGLWTAGYLQQMHAAGTADHALLYLPEELRETALLAWVRGARPDAIIGTDPRIPQWLRRAGLRLPADVAYADLDLPAPDGDLAGIYQDAPGIGACAIDLLAGQLLRHERGLPDTPKISMIESRWADGATAPATPPAVRAQLDEPDPVASHSRPVLPSRPVPFD